MRILIIRLSSIGDCVLASPVLEALRDRYPEAHIAWAVQAKSAPVVKGLPGLDDVILWENGNKLREFSSVLRRARQEKFDVALDLQGLDKAGIFSLATGANRRISGEKARRIARLVSNEQVNEDEAVHARLFYLRRAAALDIAPDFATRYYPRVPITDEHRHIAEAFLLQAGIEREHSLVGLNLGAAHDYKRWPTEYFGHLAAELLLADANSRLVVFGAPADQPLWDKFIEVLEERLPRRNPHVYLDRVVSAVGELNLMQMAAAAQHCRAFVTSDTGPMHIAAAAGVPIVALFGPTNSHATAPVHKPGTAPIRILDAREITGTWPAPIDALTVEDVLDEVHSLVALTEGLQHPAQMEPAFAPIDSRVLV
jgi:ADP-heptose:LPS heptosyltransferase